MPKFTILGYYEDNKQPWATSVEAIAWEEAQSTAREEMTMQLVHDEWGDDLFDPQSEDDEQKLAEEMDDKRENVIVVGVVHGEHQVVGGDYEDGTL